MSEILDVLNANFSVKSFMKQSRTVSNQGHFKAGTHPLCLRGSERGELRVVHLYGIPCLSACRVRVSLSVCPPACLVAPASAPAHARVSTAPTAAGPKTATCFAYVRTYLPTIALTYFPTYLLTYLLTYRELQPLAHILQLALFGAKLGGHSGSLLVLADLQSVLKWLPIAVIARARVPECASECPCVPVRARVCPCGCECGCGVYTASAMHCGDTHPFRNR